MRQWGLIDWRQALWKLAPQESRPARIAGMDHVCGFPTEGGRRGRMGNVIVRNAVAHLSRPFPGYTA